MDERRPAFSLIRQKLLLPHAKSLTTLNLHYAVHLDNMQESLPYPERVIFPNLRDLKFAGSVSESHAFFSAFHLSKNITSVDLIIDITSESPYVSISSSLGM